MTTLLSAAEPSLSPPVAKTVPKTIEAHGDQRQDPYFWLRDDARKNPEVISYLEAENRYTEAVMKPTEELQKKLYDEILARIKQTDESVPYRKGDYWYFSRTVEGQQYGINSRKKGSMAGAEEILLDQNVLAKGEKYFRMANMAIAPNQQLVVYGTDTSGDEVYTLQFKDLKTGQLLADKVPGVYYSVAWSNDNKTVFYTVVDEAKRPYKVFRHTLGTDPKSDAMVFHETDERFELQVGKSKNDRFIYIQSGSKPAPKFAISTPTRPPPPSPFSTRAPPTLSTTSSIVVTTSMSASTTRAAISAWSACRRRAPRSRMPSK